MPVKHLPQFLLTLFFCLNIVAVSAQTSKQLAAKRTTTTIKIDGNLDDNAWKSAPVAADFIEFRPTPGKKEEADSKTEVYILYDNTAVYIGGYCHEKSIDSISKELIGRDRIGANDFVGIIFDTYHDKINAMGFYVTPLGEQYDARYYPMDNGGGEDDSWNAVWNCESKLQKDGWTFEIRIPYSALRFNTKDIQTWGLNITRRRQKTGQQYMWNEVDPKKNGFINQFGEWAGIEKIQAPLRLSFMPYFSTYLNHYPHNQPGVKNTTSSINGGMDVKYGINQSFTLDMTLIPDFGQVQSDNQVLNLTPFEVKFNENRAFFNEGTELFSKGNLFYSRRVGGVPLHYYDAYNNLQSNEQVIKNPSEVKLVNATKISGRNKKKLGIGFFNAITSAMEATIEDDAKNTRTVQTAPLTNYNIFVLDQSLKNNSSISFINTNVLRSGSDYDANVSAALFNINNKKNSYNFSGKLATSQLINVQGKNISGFAHTFGFGKTNGRLRFQFNQELTDDKYDHNDLGILFNNNFFDHYLWVGYRWLDPGKWYNRININYNVNYSRRFKPSSYQSFNTNINANVQLKNLMFIGFYTDYQAEQHDFYEPRIAGSVFKRPASNGLNVWAESNFAKKYSYGGNAFIRYRQKYGGGVSYNYGFFHRFRFSDQFSLSHELNTDGGFDNLGYAAKESETVVIFGKRDRNTVENVLSAKYNFTNKMGINLRVRHYWSKVDYSEFYNLNTEGNLVPNSSFTKNVNQNFNAFNVDLVYTWQFAPGSFINIVWKDAVYDSNQEVQRSYFKNFGQTMEAPQNNNLSLKVIYFLDYLDFKKKK
jgi:Domain of unknown function (DUF5916)